MVIEESGNSSAVLQHLDKYNDQICDKLALMESKGNNSHQYTLYTSIYRNRMIELR
jgi:hypothetical protein